MLPTFGNTLITTLPFPFNYQLKSFPRGCLVHLSYQRSPLLPPCLLRRCRLLRNITVAATLRTSLLIEDMVWLSSPIFDPGRRNPFIDAGPISPKLASYADPSSFSLLSSGHSTYEELLHWQRFFFADLMARIKDAQAVAIMRKCSDLHGPHESSFGCSFALLHELLECESTHQLCHL